MQTHPLATDLNQKIRDCSPGTFACLSRTGREIYFPAGILQQSAEAKRKATRFNVTIGIAVENGAPMFLEPTRDYFKGLSAGEIYSYAPPEGIQQLREAWQEKIYRCNPSLEGKTVSLPVVTSALTHGLSMTADLFVDRDDVIIIPDKRWGAYDLIYETRAGGRFSKFPLFDARDRFNVQGLADTLEAEAKTAAKLVILLNTPNNPTGYTPSLEECREIYRVVRNQADRGTKIVTISDDAYFGLFYEDSMKESLFTGFCDLHENVLAVKLDAATKESFAWGFRTGFITFGTLSSNPAVLYNALETKVKGMVRSTISSANHPSQEIVYRLLKDPQYEKYTEAKFQVLKRRANRLKQVLSDSKYDSDWSFYPFNSGYFMCLNLKRVNAEQLRLHLMDRYGVGTISIGDSDLRIAFSSLEEDHVEELVDLLHKAVREMSP